MNALEIGLFMLPLVSATALSIIFGLEGLGRRAADADHKLARRWAGFRWLDKGRRS